MFVTKIMTQACASCLFFFFQAEDGIRDVAVTGVQTCALPILLPVTVVARLSEVLSTSIYIKPVCEPLADSAHMTSGSPRCLQDGHVVASLHQFVGARKPGNAGPSDYDFPGSPRLATGRDRRQTGNKKRAGYF